MKDSDISEFAEGIHLLESVMQEQRIKLGDQKALTLIEGAFVCELSRTLTKRGALMMIDLVMKNIIESFPEETWNGES